MIDRNEIELRIMEHTARAERANQRGWQQRLVTDRPIRAALAATLITLAARLGPANLPMPRNDGPIAENPAT